MIYTRIDTYSVILNNVSIRQTLNKFDVKTDDLDDIFNSNSDDSKKYKKSDVKFGSTFVFTHNGIRIEVKYSEYSSSIDSSVSVFDFKFSYVRLYLSGEGIDFLISIHSDDKNYNLFTCLSDPTFYHDICGVNYRVTRCDFAYDYINELSSSFDEFRKYIAKAEFSGDVTDTGRLFNGVPSGLSFQFRGGSERTVYLGSSGSDRMIRVYDKKFQLTKKGFWETDKNPYDIYCDDITSWNRVEFQTRDNFAHNYLLAYCCDFVAIMGEIKDYFLFRDKNGKFCRPWHSILNLGQKSELYKMQIAINVCVNYTQRMLSWRGDTCTTANSVALIYAGSWENLYYNDQAILTAKSTGANSDLFIYKRNKTLIEAKNACNMNNDEFYRLFYYDDSGLLRERNPFYVPPIGPYV